MKKLYSPIVAAILLLLSHTSIFSQNNLSAGDIVFTSYQSDLDVTNETTNFEDRFSIMVLKSGGLAAGTTLFFTDYGWNTSTASFAGPGIEGFIKWVVPAGGITQGTEVYFILTYNSVTSVVTWGAYTTETGTTNLGIVTTEGPNPAMQLAASGDQILAFQTGPTGGPASAYDNATRRFITAIHANIIANVTTYAAWDGPTPPDLGSSSLPPGLVNGVSAFLMSPGPLPNAASTTTTEPDNGKYNCAVASGCTATQLATTIYTSSNWAYSANAFPLGTTVGHCGSPISPAAVVNSGLSGATICAGAPQTFSGTATGATSYQWQESATVGFESPTTLANGGVYSGATTNTLTINNTSALNGKYYRMVALNSCSVPTYSGGAMLTATPSPLPTGTLTVSQDVSSSNMFFGPSCNLIVKVTPSGGSQVSGSVSSKVWVEPEVKTAYGWPYVQRHYEILPASNLGTETATITLYFSQAEFNAFNAAPGSTLNLPTGPSDNAGKANLRIGKYSGISDGSGLPGTYSSSNSVIDPVDSDIIWNAATSQWEVSFATTGFSGFIVQSTSQVLPVSLLSFTALPVSNDINLKWQTASEVNNARCEIERSSDGNSFTKVGTISGNNSNSIRRYEWIDAGAALLNIGKLYYRLKMISVSGAVEYSNIIVIPASRFNADIVTGIAPNPFKDRLGINLNMPKDGQVTIKVADLSGRILINSKVNVGKGFSTYQVKDADKLTSGTYFLSAEFEGKKFSYKVVK